MKQDSFLYNALKFTYGNVEFEINHWRSEEAMNGRERLVEERDGRKRRY